MMSKQIFLNRGLPRCLWALMLPVLVAGLGLSARGGEGPPEFMTYQGFLVDGDGIALGNVAPANYDIDFGIYAAQTGGSALWTESQTLTVSKGYFSALLGEGGGGPLSPVFSGADASDRYMAITVKGVGSGGADLEILPRLRLVTSPYAFVASQVADDSIDSASVAGNSLTSDDLAPDSVTASEIAEDAVGALEIAPNAVQESEIAAGAVGASEIAANAVGWSEMDNDAIGLSEMRDNAIGNAEMRDNAIGLAEMANDAIGNNEMRDDAIGNAEMRDNAVGSSEVINGSLQLHDIATASDIPYVDNEETGQQRILAGSSLGYGGNSPLFNWSSDATPIYTVTFDNPFKINTTPVVTVTPILTDGFSTYATVSNVTRTGFTVVFRDGGAVPRSSHWMMIVVGVD